MVGLTSACLACQNLHFLVLVLVLSSHAGYDILVNNFMVSSEYAGFVFKPLRLQPMGQ